uniref:Uncharacterized protein n=1 Tax=Arundo donax TaxID=35708 RepID=A0A0A9BL77_ARUDO
MDKYFLFNLLLYKFFFMKIAHLFPLTNLTSDQALL